MGFHKNIELTPNVVSRGQDDDGGNVPSSGGSNSMSMSMSRWGHVNIYMVHVDGL